MPDLNSVPPSPHVLATAPRRASSQQMPPPPVPASESPSLNILPSNQSAVNAAGSSLPSPNPLPPSILPGPATTMGDNTGVGPGPGPTRHPRPLTAADLHSQLEREQEAVVNRLTRELSLLRAAQNSSVVSNASSTSASAVGVEPPASRTGRHQRTSSNASSRSLTAQLGSVSTTSLAGISSPAPVRPTQPVAIGGIALSRQGSSASRRSRAGSPSPAPSHGRATPHQGSYPGGHIYDPSYFGNRLALPTSAPSSAALATPTSTTASELSPGILPATTRYEETVFYRSELETAKRENEALRRRIRELERMVRDRRASDASRASTNAGGASVRQRSDSVSTTASVSVVGAAGGGVSIAGQREGTATAGGGRTERPRVTSMLSTAGSVGVGVPDDEVKVGESASSAGLALGREHQQSSSGSQA
ncbi:hypothetical protein B0H66DRAFT_295446 [Apodospora peruviana]|uniref:Uncharacterized protein n=1 Tax=Apodospora peruviana TaxID=516989 RepID=A0AAE0I0V8_9PEZI|nr:hypothetical protein B0H66DRAFT_295446 [Apodospora peruviana]